MKKFALIAATLICFAGCARNDTDDMGAADTSTTSSDTSAIGTPASGQIGRDSASTPPSTDTSSTAPGGSSTLNTDTNNLRPSSVPPSTGDTLTPPPAPPADEQQPSVPQQGSQSNP